MTQTQQHCATPDHLLTFLRGQLSSKEESELQLHLNDCVVCRERLEDAAADADAWNEAKQFFGSGALRESSEDSEGRQEEAIKGSQRIHQVLDTLAPTDDPESLGRIGGYEVTGVVGAGGMGVVLKAQDRSLDRIVAVKVMSPHLASSGSARKRFAREAKAAAAVLHPNVIAIHSVASEDANPYLVMPYVRGASLQKRIDSQGPLPLKDVLRIGAQIAAGLAAAHEQGLVHRDIKPANILLEEGVERVTITDFGLARAVDDASMTRSGVIAGTPQYMSPEQTRGEPIDARSDLFSLGSVLYAMCAGRSPFRAETTYGVLHRIANDNPTPVCDVNSDVPEWLGHIIERLMAKRPEDRIESTAQVAELLEGCLAHVQQPAAVQLPEAVTALAPNRTRRPPIAKYIAAAAGGVALFFAGILIVLELNKGTLTIESEVDDVPIRIVQDEKAVKQMIIVKGENSIRISAGKYIVEIDGEVDGVYVEDDILTLTRGAVEIVHVVRTPEDSGSEFSELYQLSERRVIGEQSESADHSQVDEPPRELSPAEKALSELEAEYNQLESAYHQASEDAVDEVELDRVYEEMDPRHIMPSKYLAMEETYRGTDEGLKALVQVCGMARSVAGANSPAGKGRREAVKRVIQHYLQREDLESIIATLGGGPFVPQADELLQALVERSPFRKTQAEALIAQINFGKEALMVESQMPKVRAAVQDRMKEAPPTLRDEFEQRLKLLENTDFNQLRRDLNEKLGRLAKLYSDVSVKHYGTGGTAAQRLSHAINKVIIGQPAPELEAFDIDGKPFRLSELRGKHVVLMFAQSVNDDYGDMYAPMRQLVAKYKQAPMRVVGIMSNADQTHLHAAAKRGDINWTVISQPLNGPLQLDWGIEGYPTACIIDADGMLHPPLHMPYYGEGGYDTAEIDEAMEGLLRKGHKNASKSGVADE
ncbi:protein kinase domain-containing protein [Stieleria varia]|uniref:non-specific serine/threonine protein kinase n=1 Tax=Stieleria varia TaxID=2528005 RepID=A0A5C6B911_9BACT|nr:protein kinase [Stieleria varia]TWU07799.1 Serine/threonine-protein kinase PrkC [Stieleria varia]